MKKRNKKPGVIAIAVFVSVVLYLAGVFSGLGANKILKEETEEDINLLERKTENQIEYMKEYIDFLDKSVKNLQLGQVFAETLDKEEMCEFSEITMDHLFKELNLYWDVLPYRIEEYEKNNELSEEYKQMKKQYTQVSIRTWIIAKNRYEKCNKDIVYGLYFYSRNCSNCVKQGKELDKFSRRVKEDGRDIALFTIDTNSEEQMVKLLKDYYGVNTTPAIIVNDRVFQGRVFEAGELVKSLK